LPEIPDWREGLGPVDQATLAVQRRIVESELRLAQLDLARLRQHRRVTQATVAEALDVSQPNISRIEAQDDIRLSTLGHYLAALGGRLEVRAVFDDEAVELLKVG
jgi:DNA-binding XRE family transcriptional regulator